MIQWDASGNFTGEKLADAAGTFGTSTVGGLGVKPGCMSNCTVFYAGAVTHSLDCPGGPVNIQQGYIAAWNFSSGTNPWGTDAYNYYVEDCVGGVEPFALDVNHAGDPVIAGQDSPPANPTVKAHAFFARYVGANGAYDPLPFSTSTETTSNALDVAHDARDNFIIVGSDSGVSGDLQGAIQPTYNGGASDGVVLKIFPDGAAGAGPHDGATIVFASLFGGTCGRPGRRRRDGRRRQHLPGRRAPTHCRSSRRRAPHRLRESPAPWPTGSSR